MGLQHFLMEAEELDFTIRREQPDKTRAHFTDFLHLHLTSSHRVEKNREIMRPLRSINMHDDDNPAHR